MSFSGEVIVADIGGTHARFAIAVITDGRIASLENVIKMAASDHASLQIAWENYAAQIDRELPHDGAIAAAGPVQQEMVYFTNSSWMLRPALIGERLKLDRFTLVNDFGAVGHAVAQLDADQFEHICGPEQPFTGDNVTTVLGPGTGLGVVQLLRSDGQYFVTETEGGHLDFGPLDPVEDRILLALRKAHRRVSAERIVSGPGLKTIYQILAELEHQPAQELDDKELWTLALSGKDALASAAFDRFCLSLGSVAGDLALVQGANNVVMAGGLGARISDRLTSSGFRERFIAKGRFQSMMEGIGVYRLLHEEPGLYGAAAAFLREHDI